MATSCRAVSKPALSAPFRSAAAAPLKHGLRDMKGRPRAAPFALGEMLAHSSRRLAVYCRSVRASGSDQNQRRRAMNIPIHREGWPFIALFAAVNLLGFLFS